MGNGFRLTSLKFCRGSFQHIDEESQWAQPPKTTSGLSTEPKNLGYVIIPCAKYERNLP